MIKKFGFGKTLFLYTLCISLFVSGCGFILLYTSQNATTSLSQTSQNGLRTVERQTAMIKSMALVHSNVFPVLAEKDAESRSIRMDVTKGFMDEFSKLVDQCGESCDVLKEDFKKYSAGWNDIVVNHINKNDMAGATELTMTKLNPIAEGLFDKLDKKATEAGKASDAEFVSTLSYTQKVRIQLIVLMSALVLMIMGGGIIFQKVMVRSFAQVTDVVSDSVTETSSKAGEILNSSEKLSNATTKQAAAIEETVASIEELSVMVQRNADHARQAADLSKESSQAATDGGKEITNLISAMRDIYEGSRRIEEIINVIDDIAFQTNLLALNAAVEAARAGEQGKGFAVVADAVRSLAQRSAGAAKEIGTLIQESVQKTQNGTRIADASGNALQTMIRSIQKVVDLNNEISQASQEQATGIQQLSRAMTEIDQSTQTNAAVAQELATSSDILTGQSDHMKSALGELHKLLQGSKNAEGHGDLSHAEDHDHQHEQHDSRSHSSAA